MKVIAKTKSNDSIGEVTWAGNGPDGADDLTVILAVTQLLQHAKDDSPFAPRITEIRIKL